MQALHQARIHCYTTVASHGLARVLAINPATIDGLMEVGINEEQLHQQGSDFTGMEVWDREWSGHLSFDANGLIIENHRLEALLMARVVERGILFVGRYILKIQRSQKMLLGSIYIQESNSRQHYLLALTAQNPGSDRY